MVVSRERELRMQGREGEGRHGREGERGWEGVRGTWLFKGVKRVDLKTFFLPKHKAEERREHLGRKRQGFL